MSSQSQTGRVRGAVEALQQRLSQSVQTVTRNSRIFIESSDVDDLNPPDDIDEYHEFYRSIGIIRANLNKFVRDVVKPGVRIEAEDDTTQAYFMGGEDAPDFAPRGGFIENCAVIGGEKRQSFYPYLKVDIVQKWTKGTTLNELLKQAGEETEAGGPITGFKHIRPETVSARTYANTNILLEPDANKKDDIEIPDGEITKRDEAAAYVQFDDNSIVGRRQGGMDEDEIALSQNDVLKRTLDPDIGGDEATEDGIFGTPIIESIAEDAEEYQEIKRDRARAIKTKAYGVWSAEFDTDVIETPDEVILQEWDEDEQDDWVANVGGLGPGDIIGHDGSITLDQWEPTVPELEGPLQHYVADILAPLPAPKYATAFGESIANHVSDRQENSYQDTIVEERRDAERDWTEAFRAVAERHPDLDPTGVQVKIQPEEDTSPILSLDDEEMERLEQYTSALSNLFGPGGAPSFIDEETLMTEILQLPEDVVAGGLTPGELAGNSQSAEAMQELQAVMGGVEALAEFSEGDTVEVDGSRGVVVEVVSEEMEFKGETIGDGDEAVYIVADEDGSTVATAADLESSDWTGEFETGDAEDLSDAEAMAIYADMAHPSARDGLEALAETSDVSGVEALDVGFDSWPDSWEDATTPARLIGLKAWAKMGGSFRGCMTEIGNAEICAAFKDEILQTTSWR